MILDGADFSTFSGPLRGAGQFAPFGSMDPSYRPIRGRQVVAEMVVRKLTSPPGSFDDEEWGFDLRDLIGANLTQGEIASLQARVRSELLAEEYIDDASVAITLSEGALVVGVEVSPSDQPSFAFSFALSRDKIALLV